MAAQTPIANWNFKFFVLDDDEVNAFTPGGGYVYIHRGLMNYLNSEAELASVLGHEIGHDVARHPARAQTRDVLMSVGAVAAAIASGSEAIAQMANIGATAWMQGYGRENEMEADRLGLEYASKAGYRPEAMANSSKSSNPRSPSSCSARRKKSANPTSTTACSQITRRRMRARSRLHRAPHTSPEPPGGWIDNREAYLKRDQRPAVRVEP